MRLARIPDYIFEKVFDIRTLQEHDGRIVAYVIYRPILAGAALEIRNPQVSTAIHGHSANLFDLCSCDWLAIGNDGERFQRGLREPRGAGFHADEGFEPGRKFRLGDELP